MPKRILPDYGDRVYGQELQECIGIALGRASVCWGEPGTGPSEFDTETARQLVDELMGVAVEFARRYPQIKQRLELIETDDTIQKVYRALRACWLPDDEITAAVASMHRYGIYFRELAPAREREPMTETQQEDQIKRFVPVDISMLNKARQLVVDYFNKHADVTDDFMLTFDDTFVVWFCKTLQNWKAMVSTTVPDGMYYEITYDGDQQRAYVDAYKKHDNVVVPDNPTSAGDRLEVGGLVTGSPR